MARLALDQAPTPAGPARFFGSVPVWGAFAGALLLVTGPALLQSRWSPATVALVHVFTLGVIGNAMFGGVLQFLPAAAGVRVRGGNSLPGLLHAALNAGSLALVAGLLWPSAFLRGAGALLLGIAFTGLVAATLPGLMSRVRDSLLHAGIALSLVAGLATAVLGGLLVAALSGQVQIPIARWTDLHAATGVLGWALGLVAAIGRVVMPMFQGTPEMPARVQVAWLATVVLALAVAGPAWAVAEAGGPLRVLAAAAMLAMAGGGLWLQSRSTSRRSAGAALTGFWRTGFIALAAAGGLVFVGGHAVLAGVFALGIGLPMLVLGMLLEIAAFLGWITLHRHCGRGRQLPGVQRLLPAGRRLFVLRAFGLASAALFGAALWPEALARVAGGLLLAANLALALILLGLRRDMRRFAADLSPH